MKRNFFIVAVVLALAIVGIASGASGDQGRRLAGPFCVGKPNLTPFFVKATGWVSRAGVVRSISVNEQCQSTELRKYGVAVKSSTVIIDSAPAQKGDTGATGATGAAGESITGETGPAGPAGADGKDGQDGLGNGTLTICLDGKGGINEAPCEGKQTAVNVVIQTDAS